MTDKFLTPRRVARAIDVSESSLKRWCDRGLIPSVRTAGGHRRLPISGVMEFIRRGDHQLVHPELLGLPSNTGAGPRVVERATDELIAALAAGDATTSRRLAFDLHLAQMSMAEIGDQLMAPAMEEIGRLWECGDLEVFRERRACQLLLRVLFELAATLPEPSPNAPVAIGGTLEGDPYQLSTTLSEIVLRQNGWQAVSLGASLPVDTLCNAIDLYRPHLFWLSVSYFADEDDFVERFEKLYQTAAAGETALVVGGNALNEHTRRRMQYSAFCDNMQHLESFARTIQSAAPQRRQPRNNDGSRERHEHGNTQETPHE